MISNQACLSALPPLTHTTTCRTGLRVHAGQPDWTRSHRRCSARLPSSYLQCRIDMRQPLWMHVPLQECELINVWYDRRKKKKTQWPPFPFLHFWSAGFFFVCRHVCSPRRDQMWDTGDNCKRVFGLLLILMYLSQTEEDEGRRLSHVTRRPQKAPGATRAARNRTDLRPLAINNSGEIKGSALKKQFYNVLKKKKNTVSGRGRCIFGLILSRSHDIKLRYFQRSYRRA